ncbi:MAG: serine/threonine-protein kinase [Pyrinomonadaceae bacterium]
MARKGDRIGPYTLLEKLGRGGFGVVWLGEKRTALAATRVALKLSNDDDVDLEVIQREASVWIEASGHPNVLPIIDADIYDDQVVIVSEYAPHGSLERWLKQHGGKAPTVAKAVEMADGILAGLAHLHAKRIIHRDLKPANILLSEETPRLVDFGLARVLKSSSHSHTVSGTYAYMPPETFDGHRSEQTDIWSAGVILYELLAGRLPYPQDSDASLISAILNKLPEPLPDGLNNRLSEVVMRALRKDLTERYQTAREMRAALRAAYSPTTSTEELAQTQVWTGPNPAARSTVYETNPMAPGVTESPLGIAATKPVPPSSEVPVTVAAGTVASSVESPNANISGPPSREVLAATSVGKPSVDYHASERWASREKPPPSNTAKLIGFGALALVLVIGLYFAVRWISSGTTQPAANSSGAGSGAPNLVNGAPITPSGKPLGTLLTESSVYKVAIGPDGNLAASAGGDNYVRLWRVNQSNLPVVLTGHTKTVRTVAISPDGKTVASGSDDQTIRLWNAADGSFLRDIKGHTGWVFDLMFSPDGQTLVSASGDKTVRLWQVSDGTLQRTIRIPDTMELIVSISADLQNLAVFQPSLMRVRIWSIAKNSLVVELSDANFEVSGGAFSPDGRTLALGSKDGELGLYETTNGKLLRTLAGSKGRTGSVVFDPSGQLVAAGYEDGSICLWRADDGKLLKTLKGHSKFVLTLAFSGDDRVLASGGDDKTLRLWEIQAK